MMGDTPRTNKKEQEGQERTGGNETQLAREREREREQTRKNEKQP